MSSPFGSWPPSTARVTSVFTRIGAIVATLGDYTSSLITNLSSVTGATVTAALDALKSATDSALIANMSSAMLETTDGAAHQLIPAPPAGFLHVILNLGCKNAGAAGGTPSVFTGAFPILVTTTSIAAGADTAQLFATGFSDAALNVQRVAGASALMQWRAMYYRISSTNRVFLKITLTAAFQTVPSAIPAAGFACRVPISGAFTAQQLRASNLDNIAHTIVWQITRGGIVTQYANPASVTAGNSTSGGSASGPIPLLNGDVLEVKTGEAINTPGTVTLIGVMEVVPLT